MKPNIKQRIIARLVTSGVKEQKWFDSLDEDQKKHYIKMHPDNPHNINNDSVNGNESSPDLDAATELLENFARILSQKEIGGDAFFKLATDYMKRLKKLEVLDNSDTSTEKGLAIVKKIPAFKGKGKIFKKPLAISMYTSIRSNARDAIGYSGEMEMMLMLLQDSLDHLKLANCLEKGDIKGAIKASDMDTSSRETIPNRVWNFLMKDDDY